MLTVKEVAKYLHIGINQAYELVRSKDFPSFRIGQRYFIPEDAFHEWIKVQIDNKE